jgi:hypothetical protein
MDTGVQHITAGAISLCIDSYTASHDKQQLFVRHNLADSYARLRRVLTSLSSLLQLLYAFSQPI